MLEGTSTIFSKIKDQMPPVKSNRTVGNYEFESGVCVYVCMYCHVY
jgi:hypothetical protein